MVPLPLFMIIMTSGRRKESITTEDVAEGDQEGEGVVTMEVAGVVVMGLIMGMVAEVAMVMAMVAGAVTMKSKMNTMMVSLRSMPLQLVVSAVWCYMFMWAMHVAPLMSSTGFAGRGRGRRAPFRGRGRGRVRGYY
jgi:hypothetical protein